MFVNSIPKSELFKYADEHVENLLPDGSTDSLQLYRYGEEQSYAWIYQKDDPYYTVIQKFRSDTTASSSCDMSEKENYCMHAIIGFEKCHLVVLILKIN